MAALAAACTRDQVGPPGDARGGAGGADDDGVEGLGGKGASPGDDQGAGSGGEVSPGKGGATGEGSDSLRFRDDVSVTIGVATPEDYRPGSSTGEDSPLVVYSPHVNASLPLLGLDEDTYVLEIFVVDGETEVVRSTSTGGNSVYHLDSDELPEWFSFSGGETRTYSVDSTALRRGSYRVDVPLLKSPSGPVNLMGASERTTVHVVIRVEGLDVSSDAPFVLQLTSEPLPEQPFVYDVAGSDVPWKVSQAPDWLTFDRTLGDSLAGGLSLQAEMNHEALALGPGSHRGEVVIENDFGDEARIPFYLQIARPELYPLHDWKYLYQFEEAAQLHSFAWVLSTQEGDNEDGALPLNVRSDADWLIPESTETQVGHKLVFRVDPEGLSDGEHRAHLTFEDKEGAYEPAKLAVLFVQARQRKRVVTFGELDEYVTLENFNVLAGASAVYASDDNGPFFLDWGRAVIARPDLSADVISVLGSAQEGTELVVLVRPDIHSSDHELHIYSYPELELLRAFEPSVRNWDFELRRVGEEEYLMTKNEAIRLSDGEVLSLQGRFENPGLFDDGEVVRGYDRGSLSTRVSIDTLYGHYAQSLTAKCPLSDSGDWSLTCKDGDDEYLVTDDYAYSEFGAVNRVYFPNAPGLLLVLANYDDPRTHWLRGIRPDGSLMPLDDDLPVTRDTYRPVSETIFLGTQHLVAVGDWFE